MPALNLLSDKMNEVDFQEIRQRILKTQMAKDIRGASFLPVCCHGL